MTRVHTWFGVAGGCRQNTSANSSALAEEDYQDQKQIVMAWVDDEEDGPLKIQDLVMTKQGWSKATWEKLQRDLWALVQTVSALA